MSTDIASEVRRVESVDEAVAELTSLGADGAPLAGGTWIMRSWLRSEPRKAAYVALRGIAGLRDLTAGDAHAELGALATHADIAALGSAPAIAGLRRAAALSAFPAVRSVATLGGNLAARGFPEADLIPPLLAGEAEVEFAGPGGRRRDTVANYLLNPGESQNELITRVRLPTPNGRRSSFTRFTVRGGGEYAVASVAVSADLDADGVVTRAGVAVGSVEERPRLCPAAGAELEGRLLGSDATTAAAAALAQECNPRDGLDAPGWYRREILPVLLRRTIDDLTRGMSQ